MYYDPRREWVVSFNPSHFPSRNVVAGIDSVLRSMVADDPKSIMDWMWAETEHGPELSLHLDEEHLDDVLLEIAGVLDELRENVLVSERLARKLVVGVDMLLPDKYSVLVLGRPQTLPE